MSKLVLSQATSWSIVVSYLIAVLAATVYASLAFVDRDLGVTHYAAMAGTALLAWPLARLLDG